MTARAVRWCGVVLYRQCRAVRSLFFEVRVEDDARDEDGGEQVGEADRPGEGDGESLDRAGAEEEAGSMAETIVVVTCVSTMVIQACCEALLDGGGGGLARAQLLTDTLEDEHVRVDAHTDGQDDSGNAGKRQRTACEKPMNPSRIMQVQQRAPGRR